MKLIRVCKLLALLLTLFTFASSAEINEEDIIFTCFSETAMQSAASYWETELEYQAVKDVFYSLLFPNGVTPNTQKPQEESEPESILPSVKLGKLVKLGKAQNADVNKYPFNTAGKLLFNTPVKQNSHCTAQFVGSQQVLMTAAHCIYPFPSKKYNPNKQFNLDFHFMRQSEKSSGKAFNVKCYALWRQYPDGVNEQYDKHGEVFTNYEKWNYDFKKWDYAFLCTDKPNDGNNWLGLRSTLPKFPTWTAIGYPQNYGKTKLMQRVTGQKGVVANTIVQMQSNPMQMGSSGGAWIDDLTYPSVIGVNSSFDLNSTMSSPQFDEKTVDFLKYMSKKCSEI